MEPPPPPPPLPATTKLRLMCSYNGHIIPRPQTKSLYYAGGDTRIITLQPQTHLSFSSLISHLSSSLHLSYPFTLKYQLPNHDLESLISLSTDDDLLVMVDDHRVFSSSAPSRIRLYLFPSNPGFPELELKHPKREIFFVDALKGVFVGFNGDDGGNGVLGGAESIVLETSSSFGSTSSSTSLSNLPVKSYVAGEDKDGGGGGGGGLGYKKVKFPNQEGVSSDNSTGTTVCCPLNANYQDPVALVPSMEDSSVSANSFESEGKILDPSVGIDMYKAVLVPGFSYSRQLDQPYPRQFVPMGATYYVTPSQPGVMPVSSFYPVSSALPHQQQLYYHTIQQQPVYFVPVGQPCNLPLQYAVINHTTMPQNRPPLHRDTHVNTASVAYTVIASSAVPELAAEADGTLSMTPSLIDLPQDENCGQSGGVTQSSHQGQMKIAALVETSDYGNEHHDDPARIQIYKSQPPPPSLPLQCKTVNKATDWLLSEALEQLQMDNTKQQLRTSQPQ